MEGIARSDLGQGLAIRRWHPAQPSLDDHPARSASRSQPHPSRTGPIPLAAPSAIAAFASPDHASHRGTRRSLAQRVQRGTM